MADTVETTSEQINTKEDAMSKSIRIREFLPIPGHRLAIILDEMDVQRQRQRARVQLIARLGQPVLERTPVAPVSR
jgi:hypothetical protein